MKNMNKRINVLQVGMTSGVGGVESFMCNLNENINHKEFKVDFLVHQKINDKYIGLIKKTDSVINEIPGIKSGLFKFLYGIFKFYKNSNYDIVHLNECSAVFFIYCLPLLFNKKIKLIVHSHNGDSNNKVMHRIFNFLQNRRANLKLACSDIASQWMFGNDDSIIIHNGIDLEKFKYDLNKREKIRNELKIDDNCLVIGSIARFEEQKNHIKIISIFKNYLECNSNSVLVLVGDGTLKNKIEKLVSSLNIENKVLFLGIRNDVEDLMSSFDIFLMPSLYEGLPFVCVEAQATGLPMLLSNTISDEVLLTELIKKVDLQADDNIWSNQIENIRKNCSDKDRILYNKELKDKDYDIKDVAQKVEKIYKELMKK